MPVRSRSFAILVRLEPKPEKARLWGWSHSLKALRWLPASTHSKFLKAQKFRKGDMAPYRRRVRKRAIEERSAQKWLKRYYVYNGKAKLSEKENGTENMKERQ